MNAKFDCEPNRFWGLSNSDGFVDGRDAKSCVSTLYSLLRLYSTFSNSFNLFWHPEFND